MLLGNKIGRVFVTGGSGFIGSHVVDWLLYDGYQVTVYDNFSNGREEFIKSHIGKENFVLHKADLSDLDTLSEAMKEHDIVWHLAANTDIIGGVDNPRKDLQDGIVGTFNVLESMRKSGLEKIIFSSTGAVYGDLCLEVATSESAGPLMPVSTYAAGKISSEALISAFAHLYGIKAWIFRFGNVIGARMTHGVIFDFIRNLRNNPDELLIRGDGMQEKNYFLVEECIDGMAWTFRNIALTNDSPCEIFNLGTATVTKVTDIAEIVKDEIGLIDAKTVIEGTKRAWPGDQPKVHIKVDKLSEYGWKSRLESDDAVRIATQRMLGKCEWNIGKFEN